MNDQPEVAVTQEVPKMADKTTTKKPNFTPKEAEKTILDMQDLIMKVAQYYGLHDYSVSSCIQKFGELKQSLAYKIEDAHNYPMIDHSKSAPQKKPDGTPYVKLNLTSGKKYTF